MPIIEDLFASVPGVRQDWNVDWREDARADWAIDWDAVPGPAAGAAPVNTVLPLITGTPTVGQTLSVSTGTWTGNPAPTFTYQWAVNGVDVMGATMSTYVLQAGDATFMVTAKVTATNSQGSAFANAASVGPVAP
jgi:hypothetical protein